jgi:hypothetical protein
MSSKGQSSGPDPQPNRQSSVVRKKLSQHTRMKHTGSLADLAIDYAIDLQRRSITATIEHFDSELMRMFFESLERDGMSVIEDESGINPRPQWAVFLLLAGVRFRARAVQLPYATTVSLAPERTGDRLTPAELQHLKALALERGLELQRRLGLKGLA